MKMRHKMEVNTINEQCTRLFKVLRYVGWKRKSINTQMVQLSEINEINEIQQSVLQLMIC